MIIINKKVYHSTNGGDWMESSKRQAFDVPAIESECLDAACNVLKRGLNHVAKPWVQALVNS
jgi:hypothetical protein